jgi:hypothetical protein
MIKLLQAGYRLHLYSISTRRDLVSEKLFPQVQGMISSSVIKNKKSLKNPIFNNLETKIYNICKAVKLRVLDLYLAR